MKLVVIALVAIVLLLATLYGLAKFGIIPVKKMAASNPGLASVCKAIGLVSDKDLKPALPPAPPPSNSAVTPTPPTLSKKKPVVVKTSQKSGIDRLANVYAQMDVPVVAQLMAKMTDKEVIQLFDRLPDDQVGELLKVLPNNKALALSRLIAAQKSAPQ
ncbi:MAG: hypothetical protein WCO51_00590 [bacterium]